MQWKKILNPDKPEIREPLDYLFYPKNVAVIGASSQKETVGHAILANFLQNKHHWKTRVFAVNPHHTKIQGQKSFQSVRDIPADLDLAVIVVPAPAVANVLKECIEKQVESVIIISAGFKETGNQKRTQELQQLIAQNPHTRIVGPNCFGIFVGETGLNTTFSSQRKMKLPRSGHVAFASQSGALGVAILDWASTQAFGISKFVSYGNAMDLNESDFLDYFARDPHTRVITAYLEGVTHGTQFLETAKRVCRHKPVIVLKGGVTDAAHFATVSHTGSLAGATRVYTAAFRQSGIIQARSLQELFHFAKVFETEPLPKGNRVQIITNGGGYGIITADQVILQGFSLAVLSEKTRQKLSKQFPSTVTVANPMDLVGDADPKRYVTAIKAALADPGVDALLVLVLFNVPSIGQSLVKELAQIKKTADKPLMVVSTGSAFTQQMCQKLEQHGIPTFKYPEIAAASLRALHEYARFVQKHPAQHQSKTKK